MNYNLENRKIEIGKRIKAEQKKLKRKIDNRPYNQSDLAYEIGCDQKTVSKWETGETTPDLYYALKLCELFDCELGYLLCEYDQKTRKTADIKELTGLSGEACQVLQNEEFGLIKKLIDKLITDFHNSDIEGRLANINFAEWKIREFEKTNALIKEACGINFLDDVKEIFFECFINADKKLIADARLKIQELKVPEGNLDITLLPEIPEFKFEKEKAFEDGYGEYTMGLYKNKSFQELKKENELLYIPNYSEAIEFCLISEHLTKDISVFCGTANNLELANINQNKVLVKYMISNRFTTVLEDYDLTKKRDY